MFTDVSGADIAIKDLFTYAEGTPAGNANVGSADQIWRWNTAAAKWTKYYYYSARGKVSCWANTEAPAVETTDTIGPGETFFFLRNGTAAVKLNLAGAVKELTGTTSITVSKGQLAFASNPFPVEMSIQDFTKYYVSGTPAGNANVGSADQVWRWNTTTSKWSKYYYYSARGKESCWACTDNPAVTTTDKIAAGEGFFFQRAGSAVATLTFGLGE